MLAIYTDTDGVKVTEYLPSDSVATLARMWVLARVHGDVVIRRAEYSDAIVEA